MRYNTHKPYLCVDCGAEVERRRKRCPECNKKFLLIRPTYERTEETKTRISIAHKGKPKSYPTGGSIPGVAEKIRNAWNLEMRETARQRGLKNALDPEWRKRCGLPGDSNPMWEDGHAVIPYARGWTRKIKQLAWNRADNRCEICDSSKPRHTHHKDFRKDNHSLDNLQVLCDKCHKRLHVEHRANSR